ncbi:hypothetical protein SEA_ATUIN_36 [Arthrobacter phage Atuin]|nr:hypothetical protein SEA_ATUIN_135 [Arthrobacter phage Atuin]
MHIIIALVLAVSAFLGFAQPSSAEVPANVEPPISASKDASLPTYLPEVATSSAPTPAPAPQVAIPSQPAPEVGVRCEEDMPCWDCATMGNQICGPIADTETVERCEEDMPCWDCSTMGNQICGPLASDEADALASFDSQTGMPQVTETTKLHYLATVPVEPTHLEAGQFALPDSNKFDTWHIYTWDILTTV